MSTLITVLVIVVCVLLLLIVLIQNPKGGLDSAFSTNNQVMGVRKTADFLEKATWTLGIALVVLSIASAALKPSNVVTEEEGNQSLIQEQIDEKALPAQNVPQNLNGAPLPAEQGGTNEAPAEEGN
ncbi:MAG: preprotein translocase subunit SecG [Flavobacteriales bacterium]|nr:preprotein translocase subunit SecG [Flavobacteriales bacterium]